MSSTMALLLLIVLLSIGSGIESKSVIKRQSGNWAAGNGADLGGAIISDILDRQSVPEASGGFGCAYKGGCHRGHCWAGCDATAFNNEWCYTTRGYSQDYKYVGCSSDSECNLCWKCAGSCTV